MENWLFFDGRELKTRYTASNDKDLKFIKEMFLLGFDIDYIDELLHTIRNNKLLHYIRILLDKNFYRGCWCEPGPCLVYCPIPNETHVIQSVTTETKTKRKIVIKDSRGITIVKKTLIK